MRSPALGRYLWGWTLCAVGLAWLALIGASYYAGLHEAEEITDAHLASAVNVLLQVSAFGTQPAEGAEALLPAEQGFPSFIPSGRHLNFTRSLAVLVWDNGVIVADSRPPDQRGPVMVPNGYSTFRSDPGDGTRVHHWRVFAAQRVDTERRAAAMIDMNQRTFIGRQVAWTIARPAIVVLPLIALLLWWAIQRGLRPLNALSSRVARLDLQGTDRLDEAPGFSEFTSVVAAINGLIDQLQSQAQREREFASDVAHELRTPLASIALHAVNAGEHTDTRRRAEALDTVQRESLRAGRILGELLDMARAQRSGDDAMRDVPLDALAARVISGFSQTSYESGHVLELACDPEPVTVRGNPVLLELALRNLIANALVHTRAGTLVRVSVCRDSAGFALAVSDDGQKVGMDATGDARDQETQNPGNLGIGLNLVRRIAALHAAQLVRDGGEAPMTTRFSLVWGSRVSAG